MGVTSPRIRANMPPSPTTDWRVETPQPADRGLVARLLEQVVAAEPSVAPEVADGSQRPGPWLQRVRPVWSGVVVDPMASARTLVGYAAVVADPAAGPTQHRLHDVLVAPGFAERGVEAVLVSAAADAMTALADAPRVEPEEITLEVGPVTYPDQRVDRPRRRFALIGVAVIVALGTVGVLAVQVGVNPFGATLPFLSPGEVERPDRSADEPGSSSQPAPSTQAIVPAGQPIQPQPIQPQPTTSPSSGLLSGPLSSPTTGPSGQPTTSGPLTGQPTGGPSQPSADAGVTTSLLDPVVSTVVDTLDQLTGGAVSPLTGTLEEIVDDLTDTVDGLLPGGR